MTPAATIIIGLRNKEKVVDKVLTSLLNQTVKNIAIYIYDDHSTDTTVKLIKKFKDKRLNLIIGERQQGVAHARNECIKRAISEIIFITDGDIYIPNNWVEQGLKLIKKKNIVAIEGKIIYVKENFRPSIRDDVAENIKGKQYMTPNMIYKKKYLYEAGLFNEKLIKFQDRELGERLLEFGKIQFEPNLVVYHLRELHNVKSFLNEAKIGQYLVSYFKLTKKNPNIILRIVYPDKLLGIIFPPLVIFKLITYRYEKMSDLVFAILIYPRLIYERLLIWRMAIRERILLI